MRTLTYPLVGTQDVSHIDTPFTQIPQEHCLDSQHQPTPNPYLQHQVGNLCKEIDHCRDAFGSFLDSASHIIEKKGPRTASYT